MVWDAAPVVLADDLTHSSDVGWPIQGRGPDRSPAAPHPFHWAVAPEEATAWHLSDARIWPTTEKYQILGFQAS